tara:strand:+ start:556 stop:1320 length:765 start_codon:yes stop_codon:yes gene_type:complete
MKDCVNILWRNGFGNQLFQYAYGRLLSEENNWDLVHSGKGRGCAVDLLDYGFITQPEHIKPISDNHLSKVVIDYNRRQAVELETPQVYEGYLDKIRSFYPTIEKINTEDLVVHLRLGDNGPNVYTPFEWYKKAIDDNDIQFKTLHLVTDEPESADAKKFKSFYNANIFSTVEVKSVDDRANAIRETVADFNFIRLFDKILFSNSTFAWWASVLSHASEVYFNNEWQPNHYNGMIKLGETNYPNFNGICPFSLKA